MNTGESSVYADLNQDLNRGLTIATQTRKARYHEIEAKTITKLSGIADPCFLGRYGMNLYRGCEHGCLYCDGRAERYYVEGDFASDIRVKRNALKVLGKELRRIREPGFLFLGGGVCDAYQPAEAKYRLARGVCELAKQHQLPVHVLTKSALVSRDFDLLESINKQTRAIVSYSIQTLDDQVRARFEPGAATIQERWDVLAEAKRRGFGAGVMQMPVLPGISDQADAMEALVGKAAKLGLDFVCHGGLTLRPGVQQETYLEAIRAWYPEHLHGYQRVFCCAGRSGLGDRRYYNKIQQRFHKASIQHSMPGRIPRRFFHRLVPQYTEVAILLEHRDFAQRLNGNYGSTLTKAGYALQNWARTRLGKNRRRSYNYRDVEAEFIAHVRDGTLNQIPGIAQGSTEVISELVPALLSSVD